jgi:ABC-type dipeptide/oligopeptide/nickel transport system permease subunit
MAQQQVLAGAPTTILAQPRERRLGWLRWLGQAARSKPLGAISALIILVMVVLAIAPRLVTTYDPLATNSDLVLKPPSDQHVFGTDEVGRDLLTRIVYGSRISLAVGFGSVIIGVIIGSILGLISGFTGGATDAVIQRIMDGMFAFPPLVLALLVISVLGSSTTNSVIVIGIIFIPGIARVVRSSVLSVKQNVYIEAARSIGASSARILLRHILPNVTAPIIVIASALLASAILVEASLAFLGLGTPLPQPSWGQMMSGAGRRFMETAPWLEIFPGIAISLAVLAFNLLGDAVRDLLDPKLRGGTGQIR